MTKHLKNRSAGTPLITLFGAAAALVAMNAHAALISTDGGLGVYDTVNNVTWTSNANLMATQASSYSGGTAAFVSAIIAASGGVIQDIQVGFDSTGLHTLSASDFSTQDGSMTFWGAQAWIHYLNATSYGGTNQWALPTTVDSPTSGGFPAQSSSQLAQLFYGGLGQVEDSSITQAHNASYSLFSNVQGIGYWSGTEYSPDARVAWYFGTRFGLQGGGNKSSGLSALAVTSGQLSAVPLPGAAWLLGSGLLGLVSLRRRKAETLGLR